MPTTDTQFDHSELLYSLISRQSLLAINRVQYIAYAAAFACKNEAVLQHIKQQVGEINPLQLQDIKHAVMRMAMTNNYYMAINTLHLSNIKQSNALELTPLHDLDVVDETAYYYACIAACMVNQGYSCLHGHVELLRSLDESDDAINAALRLTASIIAMAQANFINQQDLD
ncbi:hypothetical protein [Photobacterium lucens]|uniref:hypothetical protein n=1 Tax=Photobacterium lucens TaxID=2562949 RepID=UPI00136CB270|nr:hypothetical protein [Photobacterium lucens]MBP2698506.1 hypothetical protein [Vibrio parahaemolyticus]MZG55225.1 hypothetical protein [Photobacterium lucens]MZG79187.1 hypothetical protein [Photobacterium lucens]